MSSHHKARPGKCLFVCIVRYCYSNYDSQNQGNHSTWIWAEKTHSVRPIDLLSEDRWTEFRSCYPSECSLWIFYFGLDSPPLEPVMVSATTLNSFESVFGCKSSFCSPSLCPSSHCGSRVAGSMNLSSTLVATATFACELFPEIRPCHSILWRTYHKNPFCLWRRSCWA